MTLAAPPRPLPAPAIWTLTTGAHLVRFYDPARGGWADHRFYGPLPSMRFDHHVPPVGVSATRSVWYSSTSLVGAVAESFGSIGIVDRACGRHVVVIRVVSAMDLVDLVGVAARRVGLTQEVGSTTEYVRTQEWARSFYDHCGGQVGIRWRGRQSGSICIVLTDRASMRDLAMVSDHDIGDRRVWPRIASAARKCSLRVV